MTIRNSFKDGKLIPGEAKKVLKLIEHYIASMNFSFKRAKDDLDGLDGLRLRHGVFNMTEEEIDEIYLLQAKVCALSRGIFKNYLKDLYEFFYYRKKETMNEYYYHNFPLDIEKFERERVPQEKIRNLLKQKGGFNGQALEQLNITSKAFFKNLQRDKL